MHAVPVQTDEPRDEQLVALLALVLGGGGHLGGGAARAVVRGAVDEVHERVVQEHGVAGGTVDDAVEDVGYYFALWEVSLGE